jgi:hypothetical protein
LVTEAREEVDLDAGENESHDAVDQLFETGFRLVEIMEDEVEPRADTDNDIRENDNSGRLN